MVLINVQIKNLGTTDFPSSASLAAAHVAQYSENPLSGFLKCQLFFVE